MNYQLSKLSTRVADYFLVIGGFEQFELMDDDCSLASNNPTEIVLKPSIIDRYPLFQRPDAAFPDGIVLFCFPGGFSLSAHARPPSFHSFVHTSEHGTRILGCCLTIYEKLTEAQWGRIKSLYPSVVFDETNIRKYYIPKCLCVTSSWPFISALKEVLCQLYRITLRPSTIPIERYICNVLDDVPAPPGM